jgi:predicted thioesterase
MTLKPGLLGTATLVVGEEHTAMRLGSGRAPVLATPMMIALMEAAAVDCVERLLAEGQESVGVRIEVDHTAATPIGLAVTATAELKEADGRSLVFHVEARDPYEIIGKGLHRRVVVDAARFRAKVRTKREGDR